MIIVMEMSCVFFEEGPEFLNSTYMSFSYKALNVTG
jgi:hypothetical protein